MNRRIFQPTLAVLAAMLLAACGGAMPTGQPTSAPAGQAAPTLVAPANPTATTAVAQAAPTVAPPTAAPPTAAPPTLAPTAQQAAPTAAPAAGTLPTFSNPTLITNPYYPIGSVGQAVWLGTRDGEEARSEVTLLPMTKTISWPGGNTEVIVSQYVAYTGGKLVEVAYDYFAQADNGDVYYFGEEVANYEDGHVVNQEGTWLAGKEGAPPSLIMPANPKVGMVFNPENMPGVVFETDEVLSLSEQVLTPKGPITNGVLIKETLMDGSIEHKVYAAGFGIIEDRAEDEKITLALFAQAGAAPQQLPAPLETIKAQAEAIIAGAEGNNWSQVSADVIALADAWKGYAGQAAPSLQPVADALDAALGRLQKAATAQEAADTMRAANNISMAASDLIGVYRPVEAADLLRLDAYQRQVALEVAADDLAAAADSVATVEAIWARLKPSALKHNGDAAATQFDASLAAQRKALESEDGDALSAAAKEGLAVVDALEKLY